MKIYNPDFFKQFGEYLTGFQSDNVWFGYLQLIGPQSLGSIVVVSLCVLLHVDIGIVGLSVMCAHCGHNLFIYLFV